MKNIKILKGILTCTKLVNVVALFELFVLVCIQCCGSRMFIPDPGSRILIFTHPGSRISDPGSRIPDLGSRIPDPKTGRKERGEKKFLSKNFL
jgi:hypothetical protein